MLFIYNCCTCLINSRTILWKWLYLFLKDLGRGVVMAGWNGMMEFSSNPLIVFVRWGFSDSCFRVLYQSKDGEPVLSPKHGGEGGDPTNLVNKYIIIITITMSLFKYEKKFAIIILKHYTKMFQYHACMLLWFVSWAV